MAMSNSERAAYYREYRKKNRERISQISREYHHRKKAEAMQRKQAQINLASMQIRNSISGLKCPES